MVDTIEKPKFKVGDVVRCTSEDEKPYGLIGTVRSDGSDAGHGLHCVKFPGWTHGHGGGDGNLKDDGTRENWWIPPERLEKIAQYEYKDDDEVASLLVRNGVAGALCMRFNHGSISCPAIPSFYRTDLPISFEVRRSLIAGTISVTWYQGDRDTIPTSRLIDTGNNDD